MEGCWLVSNKKSSQVANGIDLAFTFSVSVISYPDQVRYGFVLAVDTSSAACACVSPACSRAIRTSVGVGWVIRSEMAFINQKLPSTNLILPMPETSVSRCGGLPLILILPTPDTRATTDSVAVALMLPAPETRKRPWVAESR